VALLRSRGRARRRRRQPSRHPDGDRQHDRRPSAGAAAGGRDRGLRAQRAPRRATPPRGRSPRRLDRRGSPRAPLPHGFIRARDQPASGRHLVGRHRACTPTRRLVPVPADRTAQPARAGRVLLGAAEAAGLVVTDLHSERPHTEFYDVGAVVYFLRLVVWIVPGFTVDRYRDRLEALHEQIERDGAFRTTASRVLIEAHKP